MLCASALGYVARLLQLRLCLSSTSVEQWLSAFSLRGKVSAGLSLVE